MKKATKRLERLVAKGRIIVLTRKAVQEVYEMAKVAGIEIDATYFPGANHWVVEIQ